MPAPEEFPLLLSPFRLGGVELRSRVVMGSMHTGLEDRRRSFDALAAYYAERARGGVGLIVTGGFSPDLPGTLYPGGSVLMTSAGAQAHRRITSAVHDEGGRIALQLLHAGRYAYHPLARSASSVKSPISPFRPWAMTTGQVRGTVKAFARCAALARDAGYDAVEIMGSEGYLLNQFLSRRVNHRRDEFGRDRTLLAVSVVRAVREAVGPDFPVVYRMSLLDLVPDGQTWDDTVLLAARLEQAGTTAFATGIGWHESRVPTIVTSVPRAAFAWATARLKAVTTLPVVASNRISTPEVAEQLLADGTADLVSMARPLLADPAFVEKARAGRSAEINTCIGCNQACLDHAFRHRAVSCLVNPRAGRELTLLPTPVTRRLRVAVVGAGPAGLAAAAELAGRGHDVDLLEATDAIGGQFRLAMRVPGKEEFAETLRYFTGLLARRGVRVRLGTRASASLLAAGGYDRVVLATGVRPRVPSIPGIGHRSVVSYADLLAGRVVAGPRVAVLGAGGVGVDVAGFLTAPPAEGDPLAAWRAEWGVTDDPGVPGGLLPDPGPVPSSGREVHLLARSTSGRMGAGPGRTTGWVHRRTLLRRGVTMTPGVRYERIDDEGLHLGFADGRPGRVLAVDTVVVCAGQAPVRELAAELGAAGVAAALVGGAERADELDAKRAIARATELALSL